RDVVPDLSDPQIALVADWMGHPATEVASAVTTVLSTALGDTPGATAVRGSSMPGMAYVAVVFGQSADLEAGRRALLARVASVRPQLPANVRLQVGPTASSTGWVFQYVIVDPQRRESLLHLRAFQDDVLRPALAAIPGVAEVASVGGTLQQVLVEARPDVMRARSVALSDVTAALEPALQARPQPDLEQLRATALPVPPATPGAAGLTVGDVARVHLTDEMPSGLADLGGVFRAVGGIVIARRGAALPALVVEVQAALARARAQLPAEVQIVTAYDRLELVNRVGGTLARALAEEVAVVVLVILIFLAHARSALVPLVTLPVVLLATFAAMRLLHVPATIMSLGGIGIALGLAVDAEVVALEACHRRLEGLPAAGAGGPGPPDDRRGRLVAAASAFAPAILTSLLITAITFLPVFAFTGETGRLLRPLALTKTLVIAAAGLVTLTLAPALRDRLLTGRVRPEFANPLTRGLVSVYRPFVTFALNRPVLTLLTGALAVLSCLPIIPRLGGEFFPRIDEGALLAMPTTLPGAPVEQLAAQLRWQDRNLAPFQEVATVFGKIGRADSATDPAPLTMAEITIALRPRAEWPLTFHRRWYSRRAPRWCKPALRLLWPEETPATTAELVARLDQVSRLPGWTGAWTAPARARLDMMATGVRTPVGVRISAGDPERLATLGAAVRALLGRLPGTRSAVLESQGGEQRLSLALDAQALARHGVDGARAAALADLLTTGGQLGELTVEGRRLRVRVQPESREMMRSPADELRLATVRASASGGGQPVPLALLGRPVTVARPSMLRSERGELVTYVYVDLTDGTDLQGYVQRARSALDQTSGAGGLVLGAGESVQVVGQYDLLNAAQQRLHLIVPLVALSMLGLLFLQFRSLSEALIVLVSVPFALVGSVWTLFLAGYPLSAPVWVGLLSVVGLAMQTGVVMVVYIDEAFHRRVREGRVRGRADIVAAHAEGTIQRLRPKLMTVTTMAAGLLPFLWAEGAGAEIMKRVAAPMLGGLLTSAFLTLEVLPVIYTVWRYQQLRRAQRAGVPIGNVVGSAPAWARR
ncbi:MAG TPA: efflux RND transporter permease subunit, partial [Polyangia bacterium]|nr:efflux RND transporter permease subunit [Polyangia bacterium]